MKRTVSYHNNLQTLICLPHQISWTPLLLGVLLFALMFVYSRSNTIFLIPVLTELKLQILLFWVDSLHLVPAITMVDNILRSTNPTDCEYQLYYWRLAVCCFSLRRKFNSCLTHNLIQNFRDDFRPFLLKAINDTVESPHLKKNCLLLFEWLLCAKSQLFKCNSKMFL